MSGQEIGKVVEVGGLNSCGRRFGRVLKYNQGLSGNTVKGKNIPVCTSNPNRRFIARFS